MIYLMPRRKKQDLTPSFVWLLREKKESRSLILYFCMGLILLCRGLIHQAHLLKYINNLLKYINNLNGFNFSY